MTTIADYVMTQSVRGECQCGRCCDKGEAPDPTGHTVDMVFFKVAAVEGSEATRFRELTHRHRGVFGEIDPLDGAEHSYLELGGWVGDQGIALQYMALGTLLGVFKLLSPLTILPPALRTEQLIQQLAGAGYLSVVAYRMEQEPRDDLPGA